MVDVHVRELPIGGERDAVAAVETIRDHAYVPRLRVKPVHLIWQQGQWPEVIQVAIAIHERLSERFLNVEWKRGAYVTSVKYIFPLRGCTFASLSELNCRPK